MKILNLFKKDEEEELKEAPLGYWEEKSYMIAIPRDDTRDLVKGIFERVEAINGVQIKEKIELTEEEPGKIVLEYDGEEYEVGFYPVDFAMPEIAQFNSFYFTDEEIKRLKKARQALTIFMEFHNDAKKSYHLQLKLAVAMVPDLIGIMDESAEKMLPARWAIMAASSNVVPSSNDLYTVQAVSEENGEVWLHTHGLCRCGYTELEILQSDKENYNNHYNLISTFANYIIGKMHKFDPRENGAYIGILINRQPVVVTCVSWTEGLKEYDNLDLGGLEDREEGHNSKTSIMFIYKSEEDEKNKKLSKVSEYDNLWGDNPIFFISNEETDRMKALARERFHFVKAESQNKENSIIIKIGLKVDDSDNDNLEHIWFELLEIDGDRFKARLTQEPYNVNNIHEGDEAWFTVEDITDWIIYTPKFRVTPGSVYVLIK